LYKQSGWERVSKAFTELPQSTEQILHPEKYFAHEAPVKVTLPDITKLLNAGSRGTGGPLVTHAPNAPATWRRLDYDVQGEWGFYLLLDEFLKSPVESRRAAAGWGGDRFAVYEGPKGGVLIASLSTWDTENDAREFFDAYVKRTGLRYPNATPLSNTQSPSSSIRAFGTGEGDVVIELRGLRVLVVEGTSGPVDGRVLIRALWQ
jgi:hypothetical protein